MVNKNILATEEKIQISIVYLILCIASLICLLPFVTVLAKSLSSEVAVMTGEVSFLPIDFHLYAYKYVINQQLYYSSLINSIKVVVVGTLSSVFIATLSAYALSKNRFKGSSIILKSYVFAMIFTGGLIPGYLLVRSLGIYDTLWALILPATINPFYLLILRSFMMGVPDSLEESAKMDGAGHFRILMSIIIPIAKPALATLCLFYAVDLWNDFFRPLIYIQKTQNYTLQLFLRKILLDMTNADTSINALVYPKTAIISIQNATIVLCIVPILLIYPFLQRYFVTGMTLGAVKG